MATRRRFSAEYKQEAVELARSSNKTASQIARDLGIDPNMLSRWCRELETSPKKAFPGQGKTRDEELAQVKKERDFLKEAAVFFAKDSK